MGIGMNAFVRQLAVLSVLWSFCELLLPDGRQQKMVRMTVSVLVMAALITAVGNLLKTDAAMVADIPTFSQTVGETGERSYAAATLRSIANQTENLCVRIAGRAGYAASAAVYLCEDGALDHIELCLSGWLKEDSPPLLNENEVKDRIALALQTEATRVWLKAMTDGAVKP